MIRFFLLGEIGSCSDLQFCIIITGIISDRLYNLEEQVSVIRFLRGCSTDRIYLKQIVILISQSTLL